MTAMVVDASMALSWLFQRVSAKEDQTSRQCLQLLRDASTAAQVPSLWFIETANALLTAERRKACTQADTSRFLALLAALDIREVNEDSRSRSDSLIRLGRDYKLTAYDATYLDLALRQQALLATFDGALAKAARAAGLQTIGSA
jgi:predicted nucleic acid-binding protein